MKKIKLAIHTMPWELDSYKILLHKIHQYYIPNPDIVLDLYIELNLSNTIINWLDSQKTKKECIDSFYNYFNGLDKFNIIYLNIVVTNTAYGAINQEINCINSFYDGLITLAADIDCDNNYLNMLLDAICQIKNKYCTIAPSIYYGIYNQDNIILLPIDYQQRNIILGWFDYYSIDFFNLVGFPYTDGLGPIDYYFEHCARKLKTLDPTIDYQHYMLAGTNIYNNTYIVDENKKFYKHNKELVQTQSQSRCELIDFHINQRIEQFKNEYRL